MTSSSTSYCGCYARWRPSRLTLEQQQDDSALRGLPWWLRQRGICLQRRRPEFSPGREAPPEEGMATHPRVLAGEARGQGSLLGRSPWGRRVRPDWARARSAVCAGCLGSLSDLRPKFIRRRLTECF